MTEYTRDKLYTRLDALYGGVILERIEGEDD